MAIRAPDGANKKLQEERVSILNTEGSGQRRSMEECLPTINQQLINKLGGG